MKRRASTENRFQVSAPIVGLIGTAVTKHAAFDLARESGVEDVVIFDAMARCGAVCAWNGHGRAISKKTRDAKLI